MQCLNNCDSQSSCKLQVNLGSLACYCSCAISTIIKCTCFSEPFSTYTAFLFYRLQRPFNLAVMPLCNAAMSSTVAEVITFLKTRTGTGLHADSSASAWRGRRREMSRAKTRCKRTGVPSCSPCSSSQPP